MPSPAGTALELCPAISAVPAGLAELLDMFPGLTSWAKFRRPCGTEFETVVLTPTLKPSKNVFFVYLKHIVLPRG